MRSGGHGGASAKRRSAPGSHSRRTVPRCSMATPSSRGALERGTPPASPITRGSEDYGDDDDGETLASGCMHAAHAGALTQVVVGLTSMSPAAGTTLQPPLISQQPFAHPAGPPSALSTQRREKGKSSHSAESKTSSSTRRLRSSPSASESPSLASPRFLDAVPVPAPRTAQEFEGFPNDLGLHTAGIERLSSGFPSPRIGGPHGKQDRQAP